MSFTFVPNPHAADDIAMSEGWARHLFEVTAAVAAAAKVAFEMQGPHPYAIGDYVAQIEASVQVEGGRLVGRVDANDEVSWWIEVGTSDTPTFAPLRLGADMVGLHLTAAAHRDRA
jgi:hypothetical protein